MQGPKNQLICLVICAFCCATVAGTAVSSTQIAEPDASALNKVLEAFSAAIISKDKAALGRLVIGDGITFIRVTDDKLLALMRTKRPEVKKINSSSYMSFVDFITSSHDRLDEKFSHVIIRSDGLVATIYFDYSLNVNDLASNWGHETWGLVNTDDGWKITSIVWSESTDLQRLQKQLSSMPDK